MDVFEGHYSSSELDAISDWSDDELEVAIKEAWERRQDKKVYK